MPTVNQDHASFLLASGRKGMSCNRWVAAIEWLNGHLHWLCNTMWLIANRCRSNLSFTGRYRLSVINRYSVSPHDMDMRWPRCYHYWLPASDVTDGVVVQHTSRHTHALSPLYSQSVTPVDLSCCMAVNSSAMFMPVLHLYAIIFSRRYACILYNIAAFRSGEQSEHKRGILSDVGQCAVGRRAGRMLTIEC